jgi:hypothetical protein
LASTICTVTTSALTPRLLTSAAVMSRIIAFFCASLRPSAIKT